MTKLSVKKIDNAKPKDKEYNLSDGKGLFLRIRPSGAKSWIYFFRLPNSRQLQRMTICSVDTYELKYIRDVILPELRQLVSEGIDPRVHRANIKNQNAQAITMQTLFDAWIQSKKTSNSDMSDKWIKRHEDRWRLHLKNYLGGIAVKDVNRAHLAASLDAMTNKGIKEETRKALSTLNLMLDYGLARNYIDQNPARLLKPKDFLATASKPRDRVLSITELQRLWQALDQASDRSTRRSESTSSMSIVTTSAIKILILLGARRTEVAAMRWDELNLAKGIWKLPKERSKNGQAHTFFLPSLAIEIIQALIPHSGKSLFVFDCARQKNASHIHSDTLTGVIARLRGAAKGSRKKQVTNALLADMKSFTVHDIRRSAATAWAEYLKVPPHIIERMLNHQPQNKLIATYQRAEYQEEQKATWIEWGKLIEQEILCKT